mgnify:CR=1 FL=1
MNKGLKIAIGIATIGVVGTASYFIYKAIQKRRQDNSTPPPPPTPPSSSSEYEPNYDIPDIVGILIAYAHDYKSITSDKKKKDHLKQFFLFLEGVMDIGIPSFFPFVGSA